MKASLSTLIRTFLGVGMLVYSLDGFARFTNVSDSVGIDYLHAAKEEVPSNQELGLDRVTHTPVSNHAGAAAFDADGDGWTDFVAGRYNKPPVLFMNQRDGTFAEEGSARGLSVALDSGAFAAGDFDGDGDTDLFVVPHRGERYYLFINDGAGFFTEEATQRGAAVPTSELPHEGHSVGLVDFDLDGYLDVYVSEWGPDAGVEPELHSVLLRNEGAENPGHFENVTVAAGLVQPESGVERQHGFSTGWADFDEDGWPDLALMADFGGSRFYWNRGDGSFAEGTDTAGVGLDEFGMGIAIADYDLDGDLDYYATSIFDQKLYGETGTNTGNKLYQNSGSRRFFEVAKAAGVDRVGWSWGAAFFEYDNDGDPDLFVTNGMDSAEWEVFFYQDALVDPTTVFQNDGAGRFNDITAASGVGDRGYGKAVVVLDYDNDGDEDVIVTQTFGKPIIYRSNASENGKKWIRFRFQGDQSNRDGIGAVVRVTDGERTQTGLYNPSNAYMGQREGVLHFGLGDAGESVDSIQVVWPSGIRQDIENLNTNEVHVIVEPDVELLAPIIETQPIGGTFEVGERLELSLEVLGGTGVTVSWEKDGESIFGADRQDFEIKRLQPYDAGVYRARVKNAAGETLTKEVIVEVTVDLQDHSVARWWNEFLLDAIRKDFPAPTIHGRNLYHLSATMWDVYWAYEEDGWERAQAVFHQEALSEADWFGDRIAAQREAISYACYRVLKRRYQNSVSSERIRYNIDWLMERFGYDPSIETTVGNAPAAVGNRIADSILQQTLDDGSNEANGYADTSGYAEANEPMVFKLPGANIDDPNRWQPLAFDFRVTQNGIPSEEKVQSFVGVNWREVDTFAIEKDSGITIAWDPGPPPLFGTETHDAFVDAAVEVIRYSSLLDPASSEMIDISPGGLLNNPLGTNDGEGRSVNPVTGRPYEPNLVRHADYGRILAEFWADGPASETPPGHWNTLLNEVSEHPSFERNYMGLGEEMDELEWNIQSYLALNGAMHDAAVAAWTLKRQYDYSRPISMIRCLAGFGQSSDPDGPSYHPDGLPLIDDLIEVVTQESSAQGERHEHLAAEVGKIAIRAWAGEPADHHSQVGGVDWILAENWMPYQRSTFVTPAFAAYVSGHSTFSRAGAEVMSLLTGSPFFPGGIGQYTFPKGDFLEFEYGPSEDVVLQWATYFDAADQAGLSRLYGGIHVRADDFIGRTLGARIGVEAFLKAHSLRTGGSETGALARSLIGMSTVAGTDGRFVALEFVDGISRPIARAKSVASAEAEDREGLYFIFNDSGSGEGTDSYQILARADGLTDILISGPVGRSEGVSVRFEVEGGENRLIAIRAWSSEDSVSTSTISLWQSGSESETLLASNSSRIQGDVDSIVEVLALRDGMSPSEAAEFTAALVTPIGPGNYRVEVTGEGAADVARLEIEEVKW
ncbi:FG-GAP-like repeat-containing protein [Pelagicoccus sp. SDUM812003]|uniref:FG-GAP-like repeat-containing protein n=1 Tax=Pelagicoccus sp. SDUM812003 TaxID=3041267 RepID=UPI00280D3D8B|nr:FG-GAP-like repeat-containing protein [Pelagicoccus sp. SDUM812003]MDQ8205021.1 FG-GAP-like repeat-containing protein [Pelagicoccus sp. SDUM812003]